MATYYVSTSGDNGNTGLDQDHPWETLYYAESHVTTPGDVIALKKGDTWTIGLVLDISHGGSAGTYITWDGSLWGTGENATIQDTTGGGGGNYYSGVHIAGCDYVIFKNIIVDINYYNRHGIAIGGTSGDEGPTAQNDERYITVQGCTVKNVGADTQWECGILVRPNVNDMYNISLIGNTINNISSHGIALYKYPTEEPEYQVHDAYIGYNYITEVHHYTVNPAGSHIFLNKNIDGCIIEHNEIIQGSTPAPGIGCYSLTQNDVIIRYNKVIMTSSPVYAELNMESSPITNKEIYYNIFYASAITEAYMGVIYFYDIAYTDTAINFYNNVIIDDDPGGECCLKADGVSGITFTLKNNIFYGSKDADADYLVDISSDNVIVHSNNLYYSTKTGTDTVLVWIGASYYTRSTILGWEATAQITDPLFTTEFTDLELQAESDGIGNGVHIDGIPQTDIFHLCR